MPGENIQDWSTTAASNGTADSSINWAEGQARATVNNSARSMMAAHAKDRNLRNGSITTTGSANAQAFISGIGYTSLATVPAGLLVLLKIGVALTNTASTTLEMDGIGAVTIKTQTGSDIGAGTLVAGTYVEFRYDGTNWILLRGGIRVICQIFAASGTYMPAAGMTYCIIECFGGGGGGGGARQYAPDASLIGGGGGAAGGYARKHETATTIGASQVVTVGGGGAGGTPGGVSGNGANGGESSVGVLCIAKGGGGGLMGQYGFQYGTAGVGIGGGTGDVVGVGGAGLAAAQVLTPFFQVILPGGVGANSLLGYGGGAALTHANGASAVGYSSGGGGGVCSSSGPYVNGGSGAGGIVIITEFIGS